MRTWLAVCAFVWGVSPLAAETFTSSDIIQRSLKHSCLDWKVVGVCLWLHCKYGSCRVNTTPRVRHYLPDLVFMAYDHTGEPPWQEFGAVLSGRGTLFKQFQGGSFPGTDVRDGHSLRFKEVDAVGHPAPFVRNVFGVQYLCRSQSKALFPYFISALDHVEWRGGLEAFRPESVTPGSREIGHWPRNTWGSVFPRAGFVMQAEDPKAAAVAVQRAADIVTQTNQARVYVPFAYSGMREVTHGNSAAGDCASCERSGGKWQAQGPVSACSTAREGHCQVQKQLAWMPAINERNARWQMISPQEQNHCETFGSPDDWSVGKTSADGSYAWNFWRPYECCAPGKGRYLGHQNL